MCHPCGYQDHGCGYRQYSPVGVIVQPVNTTVAARGYEAYVLQGDGNVTAFPINTDGSLGAGTVTSAANFAATVTSPSNVASIVLGASEIIPGTNNANLFFVSLKPIRTTTSFRSLSTRPRGALSLAGNPVDTGSSGANTSPEINGGDAAFVQTCAFVTPDSTRWNYPILRMALGKCWGFRKDPGRPR
jgi:hypothetical protein